ncbi:MAG: BatD family protein [Gammaproteobacteria bacterium]|nr:BatD family protein [Gammaproteobacteria bacterium]
MVRHIIAICLMLWLPATWAASFTAQVDRQQLSTEESVTLTLQLINSETRLRAEGVNPNIDLSLLSRDFTLGIPKTDFRYTLHQGNGRSTSELTVELFPKHSGQLVIPRFNIDGLRSAAITLNVKPLAADAAPEVFARAHFSNSAPWTHQQLIVYLDVYHRVAIEGASLGSTLETTPTRIELLPNWELPRTRLKQRHKGFDYNIERLAWAIFPDKSGTFSVQTPIVDLFKAGGKPQHLQSQKLEVTVKALPPGVPDNIIIGKPQLSAGDLPASAKQNEAINWTLTLSAPAAVSSLPDYLPLPEFPAALKLYPDHAQHDNTKTNDGITDRANYTLSIMPLESGAFIVPEIKIPYFDPVRGIADIVSLPRRTINISASTLPRTMPNTSNSNTPQAIIQESSTYNPVLPWQIATGMMTLLWLVTLTLWVRRKPAGAREFSPPRTTVEITDRASQHPLQAQLLAAFNSITLEQGLTHWLEEFPEDGEALEIVRTVQRLCYGHTHHHTVADPHLAERVSQLCTKIKNANKSHETTLDPWAPEAFTASQHHERS